MKARSLVALAVLGCVMASPAAANHDTDCTAAGGTNGPNQLDCSLPDLVAIVGSTAPLSSIFVYTPSTEFNPPTCAVGTMVVDPAGEWLSIDTTVLDTSAPPNSQEVQVEADPTGLAPGIYEGTVVIQLTPGPLPPNCKTSPGSGTRGVVAVRLIVAPQAAAPILGWTGIVFVAMALCAIGVVSVRRVRIDD